LYTKTEFPFQACEFHPSVLRPFFGNRAGFFRLFVVSSEVTYGVFFFRIFLPALTQANSPQVHSRLPIHFPGSSLPGWPHLPTGGFLTRWRNPSFSHRRYPRGPFTPPPWFPHFSYPHPDPQAVTPRPFCLNLFFFPSLFQPSPRFSRHFCFPLFPPSYPTTLKEIPSVMPGLGQYPFRPSFPFSRLNKFEVFPSGLFYRPVVQCFWAVVVQIPSPSRFPFLALPLLHLLRISFSSRQDSPYPFFFLHFSSAFYWNFDALKNGLPFLVPLIPFEFSRITVPSPCCHPFHLDGLLR